MYGEDGITVKTFEVKVPREGVNPYSTNYFRRFVDVQIPDNALPVRFVVTNTDQDYFYCEVGCVIRDSENRILEKSESIFDYTPIRSSAGDSFNVALIVPTGIGVEVGGHAGDACPVAQMFGRVCDNLILHPNVVNASDINEMPDNSLYVEGSVLTRLLMGRVALEKVRANRVLTIIEDHEDSGFVDNTVNAINAARATYGLSNDQIAVLWPSFEMDADEAPSGSAVGNIRHMEHLINCLKHYEGQYDAVALASIISYDAQSHLKYFQNAEQMVNPWGGAEAMLTHTISHFFDVPSAHAPLCESEEIEQLEPGVVDPRVAAEAISTAYINSVLKGMQKSPRIVTDRRHFHMPGTVSARDVDCVVIPDGCLGLPVLAALQQGIKVIAVDNGNLMQNSLEDLPWAKNQFFKAKSYTDALGIAESIKSGIDIKSLRRPILKADVDLFYTDSETEEVRVMDYYGEEAEKLEQEAEQSETEDDSPFEYSVGLQEEFLGETSP